MKILIATDGSEFSEAAIETICRMFKDEKNMRIKIVSAYEPPVMAVSAPYALTAGYSPVLEKEFKDQAMQAVVVAERKVGESFPNLKNNISTGVLCGSPERTIVEESEKWGADLIVVGSHGYGFWERMFIGSVSNAIVHHAPCSVLIVRKQKSRKVGENN